MPQTKNSRRKADKDWEIPLEDLAEASYAYTLMYFEETLKSERWGNKVWGDLSSEAKEKLKAIIENEIKGNK